MAKRRPPRPQSGTVQRLRRRLREAEETLKAIRDGHVDALVVNSADGEQLYTLRTADQPYRLMVEQMREGALTLSATGTILFCNDRFAQLMATDASRITARNFAEFVASGYRVRLQTMLEAQSFRDDVQLVGAAGTPLPAQLSSIALQIDGVRTVAVVVSDLSHERIERGLRESNRLKDEFLATLSHELRTPLNVILGWTRMLLAHQLSESARAHALHLIERNAQAQAQLVNDLVDMSRMTTGKLRLELEPLPLVPVLEAAIESVRPAADAKHLTLNTVWQTRAASVIADPTRLQQVFWNLLSNAVKFTPDGGTITVSADSIGGRIRIDVSDTGIGIDRAFVPHVFDRFRQADSGPTRAQGGLGLGLAIVQDLVRLHGGDVDVRSDGLGRGSTFTITLPGTDQPAPALDRREKSRQTASLAGHCVVVVEDHDDSRELIRVTLENAGAAVAVFDRAARALEAFEEIRPSAVVADIGLPGEDGYAFIRKVRRHSSAAVRSVPAIAVTAYARPADRRLALEAGFQRHLTKPLDLDQLVDVVHQVARRKTGKR
jgi:signal transduction histidine kinase/CheY-like chemotaxis protein